MALLRNLFGSKERSAPGTTLFYSSDVHGSDLSWRKFLAAPRVYGASALIMGGDITGKALVPVLRIGDGTWHAYQHKGRPTVLGSEDELQKFEASINVDGFYPYVCDPSEYERMVTDAAYREEVFGKVIGDRVASWMALADERLVDWDGTVWIMPGNDDDFLVDALLDGATIGNCDERVVDVCGYPMVSVGWANPTPWSSPREESEEALAARIERLVEGVDMDRAIFNFHVPPRGTSLDVGPAVRPDLTVEHEAGEVKRVPIGSAAVRAAIERHQPLLSLHGHVHESPGVERIGRTLCVNPGSRYNEGLLDGALITLADGEIRSSQLISG
jgi:Icc-related predicted phosphoesterase